MKHPENRWGGRFCPPPSSALDKPLKSLTTVGRPLMLRLFPLVEEKRPGAARPFVNKLNVSLSSAIDFIGGRIRTRFC